ncbi:MAG TPA: RNA 2',3'-cyclic phosphodiesterase [Candidatus Eremiobacteraceae bacterium]
MAVRLFAAIPLDAGARTYVATALDALKREGARARWVRPENWHVTIAFLGEVADAGLPAVILAFRSVVQSSVLGQASLAQSMIKPFSLQLSSIGAFPNLLRPRVIWVGGREPDLAFERASLALRTAFASLGFRFDDAATPHATIGRTNGSTPLRAPQLSVEFSMPVTRLVLFESVLGPAGVRYPEREEIILG